MELWETSALTRYFSEDFTSIGTSSRLLLRKEKIRPNIWPEIPWDSSLCRIPACQTLSKALDISSTTAQVAPYMLTVPEILSDATVRRSAVDREELKSYWNLEKRPYFSR